ncbi:MAG: hypothetical protein LBE14_05510 [Treponema sp.]|nr:hypothetical protein [Treponema sp.]
MLIDKTPVDKTLIDKTLTDKTLIDKTLRLLEYGEIMKAVAERALSEEAAAALLAETPSFDPPELEGLKTLVAAALDRINSGDQEPR